MSTKTRAELFNDFIAADLAWTKELEATFGKRHACNIRYMVLGQGAPGTNLRALYNEFDRARDAYIGDWNERKVA